MKNLAILLAVGLLGNAACAADDPKLNDFLIDLSAGHVAAFQMIGLDKSAVTDLQTPKDLVAALQAAGDSDSKGAFGLAYSPGRSAFVPVSVAISDYVDPSKPLTRLWGSATFSYAQNKKSLGGVDYSQNAVAAHVAYYLNSKDDPVVAGFNAVVLKDGPCKAALLDVRTGFKKDNRTLVQRIKDKKKEVGGRDLTPEERDRIDEEMLASTSNSSVEKLQVCAQNYVNAVKEKWNASHVDVVLGQGWIKSPGGGRLSLGRHAALALSVGLDEMPNSLFNLTVRRVDKELELDTITATPAYKRTSTAGARYTYGYGDGRRSYLLAEVSNVKTGSPTIANAAFKRALGFDYKLAEGVWLELRAGRAVTTDGTKTESKALFNLKFSPETTLAKDAQAK